MTNLYHSAFFFPILTSLTAPIKSDAEPPWFLFLLSDASPKTTHLLKRLASPESFASSKAANFKKNTATLGLILPRCKNGWPYRVGKQGNQGHRRGYEAQ
jgi:hypothetical protein